MNTAWAIFSIMPEEAEDHMDDFIVSSVGLVGVVGKMINKN